MTTPEPSNDATMMGRIIIEHGLASREEVEQCVSQWRLHAAEAASEGVSPKRLDDLLVASGILTHAQLERVRGLAEQHRASDRFPGYRIIRKLGEGAMAKVYLAQQLSLDRMVAIKVLPRHRTADPAFVDRFYAEGRAAAKLNHPNIVQAIDVGNTGDQHFFVMEYVEGHTVYDHLKQAGRYSEKEAIRIAIEVSEALQHAHQLGFIHRDVKPKNIMINTKGTAKLADMGLARQVTDKEAAEAEAGRAFGTPYYISPEQIRGQLDIGPRADIYCLGATFYHMVTGRPPFEGKNPSAVMHKHLKEEPTPPDHINPELSAGVSEIIEVMMAKNREERYANCADLLEDLRAVQRGEPPIHARRKFNIASLSALEEGGTPIQVKVARLVDQPLFWLLVGSLLVNGLLLFLLTMGNPGQGGR